MSPQLGSFVSLPSVPEICAVVKEFLVSLGVDASRLQTKSFGKERPTCSESDESCWQQNRRGYSVISAGAGS